MTTNSNEEIIEKVKTEMHTEFNMKTITAMEKALAMKDENKDIQKEYDSAMKTIGLLHNDLKQRTGEILEMVKEILLNRREQINIAFERTDERMMAHLHTFVNKFEEELRQQI